MAHLVDMANTTSTLPQILRDHLNISHPDRSEDLGFREEQAPSSWKTLLEFLEVYEHWAFGQSDVATTMDGDRPSETGLNREAAHVLDSLAADMEVNNDLALCRSFSEKVVARLACDVDWALTCADGGIRLEKRQLVPATQKSAELSYSDLNATTLRPDAPSSTTEVTHRRLLASAPFGEDSSTPHRYEDDMSSFLSSLIWRCQENPSWTSGTLDDIWYAKYKWFANNYRRGEPPRGLRRGADELWSPVLHLHRGIKTVLEKKRRVYEQKEYLVKRGDDIIPPEYAHAKPLVDADYVESFEYNLLLRSSKSSSGAKGDNALCS